jgi:hypothetical protein
MGDIKKYYFSAVIAKEVGVEEAIMFSNIYFWVEHNKKGGSNYHNGKYWTYNSARGFSEQYMFWSEGQIRRILGNLEKKLYIETGRFNRMGYDKTKWYTVTPKGYETLQKDSGYIETMSRVGGDQ